MNLSTYDVTHLAASELDTGDVVLYQMGTTTTYNVVAGDFVPLDAADHISVPLAEVDAAGRIIGDEVFVTLPRNILVAILADPPAIDLAVKDDDN
jgi:hypothetical protein